MKKALTAFTATLFVAALLVTVSTDATGHMRFTKKASALGQQWKIVEVNCYVNGIPNGKGYGCFSGTDASCTPINCEGM